jgi:hypothetical protein
MNGIAMVAWLAMFALVMILGLYGYIRRVKLGPLAPRVGYRAENLVRLGKKERLRECSDYRLESCSFSSGRYHQGDCIATAANAY